jgi:hypothetical protein
MREFDESKPQSQPARIGRYQILDRLGAGEWARSIVPATRGFTRGLFWRGSHLDAGLRGDADFEIDDGSGSIVGVKRLH